MSAEWPTKISAPMTEPSIDQSVRNNTERGNAEGAGSLYDSDADTSAKPKGGGSRLDAVREQLQKPDMPDRAREMLEHREQELENRGDGVEGNKSDESSQSSPSPSEDYGQNGSTTEQDPKEAASDSQSKLDRLKSEHLKGDYGQLGNQSDSTPTTSEPTDDIKS